MASRISTAKTLLGKERHLASLALGDDELRRWQTHCRGLEDGEVYPWATDESRALVSNILGCLFGEELSQLEAPSRAWARTNSTMAIFTRRLGCLRELVGQESMINGRDSFDRLQEIFDRVTIVATEAALVSLAYTGSTTSGLGLNGEVPASEPAVIMDAANGGQPQPNAHPPRRRRVLPALVMAAVVAVVAGLAFALTRPSPAHHPGAPAKPAHTTSTSAHVGSTAKTTIGGSSSTPVKGGSGTAGLPRSSPLSTLGGAGGASKTGPTAGPGNAGPPNNSANPGTSGAATPTGSGGSTSVTLPSGAQLTVPPLTIP
jgi:hypothetical protein